MIDLEEAANTGIEYIYMMPRAGESQEAYLQRVGLKTAQKFAPKFIEGYVNTSMQNTNWGGMAGTGLSSALAGIGTLAAGGSAEDAAIKTAKTAAIQTAYRSSVPWAGAALTGADILLSDTSGGEKSKALVTAAPSAMGAAGSATGVLSGTAATGVGIPFALLGIGGGFRSAHKAKHNDFKVTFNQGTKKLEYGTTGRNAMGEWNALSNKDKTSIYHKLSSEGKRRNQVFENKFKGLSKEDKKIQREELGSSFFNPALQFEEGTLDTWRGGGDLKIKYDVPDYGRYGKPGDAYGDLPGTGTRETFDTAGDKLKEIDKKRKLAFSMLDQGTQDRIKGKRADYYKTQGMAWNEKDQGYTGGSRYDALFDEPYKPSSPTTYLNSMDTAPRSRPTTQPSTSSIKPSTPTSAFDEPDLIVGDF